MLRPFLPAELAGWTAAEPVLEQTPVWHSGAAGSFQEGYFSTQRWPVESISLQKRHVSVIRDSVLSRRSGFPSSSCRCSPGHKVPPLPHAPPVPSGPSTARSVTVPCYGLSAGARRAGGKNEDRLLTKPLGKLLQNYLVVVGCVKKESCLWSPARLGVTWLWTVLSSLSECLLSATNFIPTLGPFCKAWFPPFVSPVVFTARVSLALRDLCLNLFSHLSVDCEENSMKIPCCPPCLLF